MLKKTCLIRKNRILFSSENRISILKPLFILFTNFQEKQNFNKPETGQPANWPIVFDYTILPSRGAQGGVVLFRK